MYLDITILHFLVSSWIPSGCFVMFFSSSTCLQQKMTKSPKLPFWEETPDLASFWHNRLYFEALDADSTSYTCCLHLCMAAGCTPPSSGPKPEPNPIPLREHQLPLPGFDFSPCFCSQTEFPILFEDSPCTCFCVFVLRGGLVRVSSSSHQNGALKLDFHSIKSAFYSLQYRNVFCHWV